MLKENCDEIRKIIEGMIFQIKPSSKDLLKNGNEKIVNDLGFDSIDVMTLMVEVEEKFNIRFEEEMLLVQSFDTVDSLTEFVQRLIE